MTYVPVSKLTRSNKKIISPSQKKMYFGKHIFFDNVEKNDAIDPEMHGEGFFHLQMIMLYNRYIVSLRIKCHDRPIAPTCDPSHNIYI